LSNDRGDQLQLSVVTPVFNGAAFIAENVEIIRRDLGAAGVPYELIVVSDGSVDETVERALAAGHPEVRVLHYDRNLGKGYAVKLGLLAARAPYVGFIDSDLDLHPAELPRYHQAMREQGFDAAIGSKRHPESRVEYPRRRRFYSWLYQQLIRVLFRLDVRDTQVGIKVFRRELIDAVVPHLLVKRYAFDLELLAVAHDSGFRRIVELPVRLEYGFTGTTGISPLAVAQALVDTAAIFYRLRILRYYRRRSAIVGERHETTELSCTVAVVDPREADEQLTATLSALERMERAPDRVVANVGTAARDGEDITKRRLRVLEEAETDLVAFLRPGVLPATNWLGALLPYFANPRVVAVGGPVLPVGSGGLRIVGAAAVYESRFAAGPVARRHVPGNLREALDQPLQNLVMRRDAALRTGALADAAARGDDADVCRLLSSRGTVLFTPEAPVVAAMPVLVEPLLSTLHAHGRARGRSLGTGRATPLSVAAPTALALGVMLAPAYSILPRWARRSVKGLGVLYALSLAYASTHAALRHRNVRVGLTLTLVAPASHLAYGAGALRGVLESVVGRPERRRERLRGSSLCDDSDERSVSEVPPRDSIGER
jgi:glycosyltransferase involved in cell wall biosynthesis